MNDIDFVSISFIAFSLDFKPKYKIKNFIFTIWQLS
jgi:hypothetical protein